MILDLRQITFYIPNLREDFEQRSFIINMFRKLGLKHQFVPAVKCDQPHIGHALSVQKILETKELELPFAIMSDMAIFNENFRPSFQLPDHTDALYLGQSRFGIEKPGEFGWGQYDNIEFEVYNEEFIRLLNNLGGYCIVYLSERYKNQAIDANWKALLHHNKSYPVSIEYARLQNDNLVLSPVVNMCYQNLEFGGNQPATELSVYTLKTTNFFEDISSVHKPNDFEYLTQNGDNFYLFYDIFVHWSRKKITAVAPFYGQDLDLTDLYSAIKLETGNLVVPGKYIPCEVDSWEPSILIDFEHADLENLISEKPELTVTIHCGDKGQDYTLQTVFPRFEISMSVIIKNENRWLPYFLEYYLQIMKVNHIYLYDNMTSDKNELLNIVLPYVRKSQLTFIPWHYRWRNRIDKIQIGQPPQESHTLNKFGSGRWIGFFDVDEFLKIPGKTIPAFMKDFNPTEIGGVSFGLRWFFYKGPKKLSEIQNPLTEFIYSKKDNWGRKKQKLMVSPQLCRYMRFHWIPEDQKELEVEDKEIFFHHYCIREKRFEDGKNEIGEIDRSLKNIYEGHHTMRFYRAHLDRCFVNAKKGTSRITTDIIELEGYLGTYTRHFYNNVCSMPGVSLLEIGLWQGASSCCFLKGNLIKATFIDNWSEFGGPRDKCIHNIRKCAGASRIKIISENCFEVDKSTLDKYNIFVYDGEHSHQSHYNAIVHFYGLLEDIAIIIIDDWNRKHIRDATFKAIKDLNIPVFYEREIIMNDEDLKDMPRHKGIETWWDGLYVFGINKNLKT